MRRTRRTVLAGLGSLTAAIAGCTTGRDSTEEQDHPFEDISVEETSLVAELAAGASVEQVNVIAPDGSTFATETVAEEATRVDFQIGTSYDPGEYRIVAVQEGESVAVETLEIAPDVRITKVEIGENHLGRIPENLPFPENQAIVSVENRGAGTEKLEELWVLGDVPNPTIDLKRNPDSSSGIYEEDDGFSEADEVVVFPDSTITIFTTTDPFAFTGDGIECEPQRQSGECQFILKTDILESRIDSGYKVVYSGSENPDGCSIQLEEEPS